MKDCVESHHRAGGSRGMGPWAFGIPIVLVSALGLLLNAYVLLVVLGLGKQIQQQTSNTLLLIHLGAVEFALCFVLLVFITGPWTIPGSWCAVHGFLLTLLHPVALWTVTGLNCDRYYAIAAPLHYTAVVSPRRVILGLVGAWIGAFILCLPPFSGLIAPYKYSQDFGCCIPAFTNDTWTIAGVIYTSVYLFVGLVLPAILITACNIRVLGIARYHRHRIASAIYEVTLSAQVTITHQRNPFFIPTVTSPSAGGPPKFHSAASTVMQLVGSVYLLYFPYCGIILWEACTAASHSRLHLHPRFASLASLLLASSPPINGLLYGLKSRTIRRSVQNYWRKKVTKSELQQEIQARTPSVAGSRRPSGSGPVSLFPFPPLQRRLSEALLNLGTNSRAGGFESGNIGAFNCNRLQPAASCNTLRVPTSESSESNRLVRTSASTASLMGYRDSTSTIRESSLFRDSIDTSKRSPIILITRTHSVEIPDGGGSPVLKRSCIASGNFGTIVTDKRRWRHISTGSDSSTGSSDASSIWTTGIAHRAAKGNLKNSIDNWPIAIRHVPLGILFNGLRASNNSESSDTTDTTATTTTSTLPSKIISIAQETQSINNKSNEKPKVERKNSEEKSESESSWGSIEEKGSNDINEDDNSEKEFVEKNEENSVEEKRSEEEKVEENEETEEGDENEENEEEEEEEEEDDDENSDSGNDNSKEEIDNEVVKKCRKRRKEKMRTQIINDEKKINENNDNIKLRPLLTTLSS